MSNIIIFDSNMINGDKLIDAWGNGYECIDGCLPLCQDGMLVKADNNFTLIIPIARSCEYVDLYKYNILKINFVVNGPHNCISIALSDSCVDSHVIKLDYLPGCISESVVEIDNFKSGFNVQNSKFIKIFGHSMMTMIISEVILYE